MESLGRLHGITRTEDDLCVAAIGPVKVFVPDELVRKLEPHVGEKIGILRTDHDYRLRIFGLQRDGESKSDSLGLEDQTSKKSLIVIA